MLVWLGARFALVLFVAQTCSAWRSSPLRGITARGASSSEDTCLNACAPYMEMCSNDPECDLFIECVHDTCVGGSYRDRLKCHVGCLDSLPDENANADSILECSMENCHSPPDPEIDVDPLPPAVKKEESNTAMSSTRFLKAANVAAVIQVGKFGWDIVKDGKPVFNSAIDYAGAIPSGASWTDLAGFQPRQWGQQEPFRFKVKNKFGVYIAEFDWLYSWQIYGRYNGVGAYIGQAAVLPVKQEVSWGWELDVSVKVSQPLNAGTIDDPIASLMVVLDIKVQSVLKTIAYSCSVHIRGNGAGIPISCPQYEYDA